MLRFDNIKFNGVYVIELTGNGHQSRISISKGEINHIMQVTPDGYIFNLLNEYNLPYDNEKCSIIMNDKEYNYNKECNGILIPFIHKDNNSSNNNIYLCVKEKNESNNNTNHIYSVPSTCYLQPEFYELRIGILLNNEHVLQGKHNNQFIVHPLLLLQGTFECSLSLLHNISMDIELHYLDDSRSNQHINIKELLDKVDITPYITIDDNLVDISVKMEGEMVINFEKVKINGYSSYIYNRESQKYIITPYLRINNNHNYELQILGQNGEKIKDYISNIAFYNSGFYTAIYYTLKSNENGIIDLGKLNNISGITVDKISIEIPKNKVEYPNELSCLESDENQIELPFNKELYQYSLFSDNKRTNYNNNIEINNTSLIIKGLKEGEYHLEIFNNEIIKSIQLHILNKNSVELNNYYLSKCMVIEKK